MLTVALTGGIAAGKTVVAAALARCGAHVDAADAAARSLQSPGGPAYGPIAAHFGPGILAPDGTIDRRRLAAVVFSDARERAVLEAIVHPLVFAATRAEIARLEAEGRVRVFVHEAALTIEAGHAAFYDRIVVAYCPPDVQAARLAARDLASAEDARLRLAAQLPAASRLAWADYVVDTSGSLADTIGRSEALYAELLGDERAKRNGTLSPGQAKSGRAK